jgi:hypothetical protein
MHYLIVGPLPSNRPERTDPKENATAAQQQTYIRKKSFDLYIYIYIERERERERER